MLPAHRTRGWFADHQECPDYLDYRGARTTRAEMHGRIPRSTGLQGRHRPPWAEGDRGQRGFIGPRREKGHQGDEGQEELPGLPGDRAWTPWTKSELFAPGFDWRARGVSNTCLLLCFTFTFPARRNVIYPYTIKPEVKKATDVDFVY